MFAEGVSQIMDKLMNLMNATEIGLHSRIQHYINTLVELVNIILCDTIIKTYL